MNILQAIADPRVFTSPVLRGESYTAWRAFLAALFGLPMNHAERALFEECTGRKTLPDKAFREVWLPCGRRGGKSFTIAHVAVYLACFRDYTRQLAPGERGTIMVMASDRDQAKNIFNYIKGALENSPVLCHKIEGQTQETIDLRNRVTIKVATASHKSTRGYTIVAALCDEVAFWGGEDSASPDTEILNALRPGMATIPDAMLLCASNPYARRGALWEAFKRHHGSDGSAVLVWKAPTRVMNPEIGQAEVDRALEEDRSKAGAEYLAEFRADVESFVRQEMVDACIAPSVAERAPAGLSYVAFVDPSGGSADSMTMAIAHREGDIAVLDCVREVRPPFSPQAVVKEFASTLKRYGILRVQGDHYGGEWPREVFRNAGIEYDRAPKSKSEIYGALLPLINSRRVDLLENPRLVGQLCALERRAGRQGRDTIDHPPNHHDDLINAAAGALVALDGTAAMKSHGFFEFARREFEALRKVTVEREVTLAPGSVEWQKEQDLS